MNGGGNDGDTACMVLFGLGLGCIVVSLFAFLSHQASPWALLVSCVGIVCFLAIRMMGSGENES